MRQKFGKLKFVRVCKEIPNHMRYFESDFDAIINGTHSQIYGGDDINSYSVYVIDGGKIINTISWYKEDQLALLDDQDAEKAEQMIEDYNFRECE